MTKKSIQGNELFKEVAALSGLPKDEAALELARKLEEVGSNPKEATLDDIRTAMAAYLEEVMSELT